MNNEMFFKSSFLDQDGMRSWGRVLQDQVNLLSQRWICGELFK